MHLVMNKVLSFYDCIIFFKLLSLLVQYQLGSGQIQVEVQINFYANHGTCVYCKEAESFVKKYLEDASMFLQSDVDNYCKDNCTNRLIYNGTSILLHAKLNSTDEEQNLQQTMNKLKTIKPQKILNIKYKIYQNKKLPPVQIFVKNNTNNNSANTGLIVALVIICFLLIISIVIVIILITKPWNWKFFKEIKQQQQLKRDDSVVSCLITVKYGKDDVLSQKQCLDDGSVLGFGFEQKEDVIVNIPESIKHRVEEQDIQITENGAMDINVDIQKDLVIMCELGSGGFVAVFKALWRTRQGIEKTVAVKILNNKSLSDKVSQSDRGKVFNAFYEEINTMLRLKHPGIVTFYGACLKPPALALLMEYTEGGSLDNYLHSQQGNRITYEEILSVLYQITQVLCYLHPNILHRDIKPQNILLDKNGYVKLADFELSQIKSIDKTLSYANAMGTPVYSAPEIWTEQKCTTKSDIYLLGFVAWEMLCNERPWKECSSVGQIIQKVVVEKQRPEIPQDCPVFLGQLIQECWAHDPRERPSAENIKVRIEEELAKNLRKTI